MKAAWLILALATTQTFTWVDCCCDPLTNCASGEASVCVHLAPQADVSSASASPKVPDAPLALPAPLLVVSPAPDPCPSVLEVPPPGDPPFPRRSRALRL